MAGLIKFWRTALQTYRKVQNQKLWVEKLLAPHVLESKNNPDGSVSEYEYYKLEHYYGIGIPVVIGEGIALLREKGMSDKERITLTYMASITGLFDDFFDVADYDKAKLEKMVNDPQQFEPSTQREKIFKAFTLNVLAHAPNTDKLNASKVGVFDAQWESKRQKQKDLTWQEHKELVKFKGGTSLNFYKDAFEEDFDERTQEAIYALGGLFQFGNDIFDVHQDTEDAKFTCVNTAEDINVVRDDYLEDYRAVVGKFKGLNYEPKAIDRFVDHLNIVVAQCLCCLDQYLKLQAKSGGTFLPKKYSREELVCDMQSWSNVLKTSFIAVKL